MRLTKTTTILLIALFAALLFIPFLGRVHLFDWDEINFAEASREMIKMDDYTRVYIDFKPFWEKPPMFFWMQSTAMKVFGVTESRISQIHAQAILSIKSYLLKFDTCPV